MFSKVARKIKFVDQRLFGARLARATRSIRAALGLTLMSEPPPVSPRFGMEIDYTPVPDLLLARLCDEYGSDKGSRTSPEFTPYPWSAHTYCDFYSLFLEPNRFAIRSVFECGLGTFDVTYPANMGPKGRPGASLRVWREFFPNAQIVGADIDRNVLFSEDRIRTHYVDQTSPQAIAEMWSQEPLPCFDLMIDDGLHEFRAGVCLFENSFHKLADGGLYFIEDVPPWELPKYTHFFRNQGLNALAVKLHRRNLPLENNVIIMVRKNNLCNRVVIADVVGHLLNSTRKKATSSRVLRDRWRVGQDFF